jgi:hypothetical protein
LNNFLLQNLFTAYYQARRNKRNTINALEFELNLEENLFQLYQEIVEKRYTLKPSICFINEYPVKREIFAADFRDRVVHHLIYNYIYQIFENLFIYDSYSCRKGKGTLFGIKRLNHFIRSCSENYHQDCYILKLDISGYFMNINKNILYEKIKKVLLKKREKIKRIDFDLLIYLIEKVIFNDPTLNCKIKGRRENWVGLPKNKSLFFSSKIKGLPIGNLTSQLFSNIYLNDFDWFIKKELKCRYYGRYVDDFFIISKNKEFLKKIIPQIKNYLQKELNLTIHPNKIYLQHFSKGVDFLGTYSKPYRVYIKTKTKTNLHQLINNWNKQAIKKDFDLSKPEILDFIAKANSYLGLMSHFKTKRLRKKMVCKIEPKSYNYFYLTSFSNQCLRLRDFLWKID